jgi:hypothetical protein
MAGSSGELEELIITFWCWAFRMLAKAKSPAKRRRKFFMGNIFDANVKGSRSKDKQKGQRVVQ